MDILDCLAFLDGNGEGADFWRSAVSGYDCRLFGFVFLKSLKKRFISGNFMKTKR